MSDNRADNRRAGLTPREVIFVDIVRDGLRRAYKAAGYINHMYHGRFTVQPSLSTKYIRHHTDAGKAYDFDAADLDDLPEIYFFIATVPFIAIHSGEAIAQAGDTMADMVRSIKRTIENNELVLVVEQHRAAQRKDAKPQ